MKLKYSGLLLLSAIALGTVALASRSQTTQTIRPVEKGLVVHEWGTFTSFQGGDGVLLDWRPLITSTLPNFVYNWQNPGLGRANYQPMFANKRVIMTLQRMETPVVYFYSDKALTADLSVQFPQGHITEWFPQAREIGPSFVPEGKTLTSLDTAAHKCGLSPKYSLASAFGKKPITNSMIHWTDIHILPAKNSSSTSTPLPTDTSSSHYFAARETDANLIQLDSLSTTNPQPQFEKFLFYRGVGSFSTPFRVTMKSDDAVILTNTGKETLSHLFVLNINDKSGNFIYVAQLLPGEEKTVTCPAPKDFLSAAALNDKLASEMSQALIKEGLYPREATAMVTTWRSSWFAENGTRVLYVLPRAWTDRTLPMTLNPAPRELTRVMVGRAEVLTPALEQNLVTQLIKARQDDAAAVAEVHQIVKNLGRFAEPAFYRALAKTGIPWSDQPKLVVLLNNPSKPPLNFE